MVALVAVRRPSPARRSVPDAAGGASGDGLTGRRGAIPGWVSCPAVSIGWSGLGVDQRGDLHGVVGEHAPSAPAGGAGLAVAKRAGPSIVALQARHPTLTSGAPLDQFGETLSVLNLLTGHSGLAS